MVSIYSLHLIIPSVGVIPILHIRKGARERLNNFLKIRHLIKMWYSWIWCVWFQAFPALPMVLKFSTYSKINDKLYKVHMPRTNSDILIFFFFFCRGPQNQHLWQAVQIILYMYICRFSIYIFPINVYLPRTIFWETLYQIAYFALYISIQALTRL